MEGGGGEINLTNPAGGLVHQGERFKQARVARDRVRPFLPSPSAGVRTDFQIPPPTFSGPFVPQVLIYSIITATLIGFPRGAFEVAARDDSKRLNVL